ncbi:MAG TPA: carboxypeptidase-like regulatory domain-containing protein [Bryobacteraceae bacterium]|jgi:hypothetical protein|nr:carboxypeptidase-like regulatory domain-containing protein [Bryobacteraceae bacterium]
MRFLLAAVFTSAAVAQAGNVRGKTIDPAGADLPATIQFFRSDGSLERTVERSRNANLEITGVAPGRYLLVAKAPPFRSTLRDVAVREGVEADAQAIRLEFSCMEPGMECVMIDAPEPPPPPIQVLSVCEALMQHDPLYQHKMVLIGVLDHDRLRLDCTARLRTGPFAWPNEIAVTSGAAIPKEYKWDDRRIREKAATITRRPGDQLVAVFGRLASPAGIEQVACRAGTTCGIDLKELNFTFITLSHDPASIRVLK